MSGSTTFSYAQAAKGHAVTQSAASQPTPNQSQAPSVNGSHGREQNATNSSSTRAPSVAKSTASNDIDATRSTQSTSTKSELSRFANSTDTDAKSNHGDTSVSVAESTGSSTLVNDQASEKAPTNPDTSGRTVAAIDVADTNETRKTKKSSKKGRNSEKNGESAKDQDSQITPPQKIELVEAVIPSVNVWAKRAEAAKSKAQVEASSRNTTATNATPATVNVAQELPESKQSQVIENTTASKPFKKDGDSHRNNGSQGPKRAGPRGARAQERDAEVNLMTGNPASWPLPETAAVSSKPQPHSQPDKEEKDEPNTTKSRSKKEWVPIPVNHSVVFETAMPGRGPRGGRVGGSRGGRDNAGNNHSSANPTERTQEATSGPRTNTSPKRPSGDGSGPREGRKGVTQPEQSKGSKESPSDSPAGQNGVVNGATPQASVTRTPTTNQRSEETTKPVDSQKDMRANNRDTHHSGQNGTPHRSSERPRGGGRGRGNFPNQNNTNGISHHPQQSYMPRPNAYQQFMPPGSHHISHYPPAGYPPMPYGGPYPTQTLPSHRKPGSVSGNRGPGNSRVSNGRIHPVPPMSMPYDTAMFPPVNEMVPQPEQFGQLHYVLMQQVDYYFSVGNCVKDMFLRKNMDSQGFVDLKVIGDFPRIRDMGFTHNQLIQACHDSANLELVMGDDGIVRVRAKEGWEKWVFSDMNQRHPGARHNGPTHWTVYSPFQPAMMSPGFGYDMAPIFSPTGDHSFAHYTNGDYGMPHLAMPTLNGANGHAPPHESQLSAAVPEFSPSAPSGFQPGAYNQGDALKANNGNGPVPSEQTGPISNGIAHDRSENESVPHLTNGESVSH